jgi:tetratricopeptide (TPR) repeat protein
MGIYELSQGNKEKGIEYLSKAIKANPNDTDAYYNIGVTKQEMGKDSEAIFYYDNVIRLRPTDFEAIDNRGVAKMRLGKYDEAIEDYKQALEVNPNFALAYSNMGNVYRIRLDFDKACENWKKALELGDENCRQKIKINCHNDSNRNQSFSASVKADSSLANSLINMVNSIPNGVGFSGRFVKQEKLNDDTYSLFAKDSSNNLISFITSMPLSEDEIGRLKKSGDNITLVYTINTDTKTNKTIKVVQFILASYDAK